MNSRRATASRKKSRKKLDPLLAISVRLREINKAFKKTKDKNEKQKLIDEYKFLGKVKLDIEIGRKLSDEEKKFLEYFTQGITAKEVKKEIGYIQINPQEKEYIETYLKLLKEGKAPTVENIEKNSSLFEGEIKSIAFKLYKRKAHLPLVGIYHKGKGLEHVYDRIIQLNKERLEKGELPLIKKGQKVSIGNAVANLIREGRTVLEIQELLGIDEERIFHSLKIKGMKPIYDKKQLREKAKEMLKRRKELIEEEKREEEQRQEEIKRIRELSEEEKIFAEKRLREIEEEIMWLKGKNNTKSKRRMEKLKKEKRRIEGELASLEEILRKPPSAIEKELDYFKRELMLKYPGLPIEKETGRLIFSEKLEKLTFSKIKGYPWKFLGLNKKEWQSLPSWEKIALKKMLYEEKIEQDLRRIIKLKPKNEEELIRALESIYKRKPVDLTVLNYGMILGIPTPVSKKKISEKRTTESFKNREHSDYEKMLNEIAEEAIEKKVFSREEIRRLIRNRTGVDKVTNTAIDEVIKRIESEARTPAVYKFTKEGTEKIGLLKRKEAMIITAYFDLLSEGKMPSVVRIKNILSKKGVKISNETIKLVMKTSLKGLFLPKKLKYSTTMVNINDIIVREQKRRLESGEPLLIKKGEEPTVENAVRNLAAEGKTIKEIKETLGIKREMIEKILKKEKKT